MTILAERIQAMDGVYNFRDYGGYAVRGGGHVAAARLFRSGHHNRATPRDVAYIDNLGLQALVDLRSPQERKRQPSLRPERFSAQLIEAAHDTTSLSPHVEAAIKHGSEDEMIKAMAEGYAAMPFHPAIIAVFRDYFAALAAVSGPQLVHCMAGKDRTGLVVALAHTLLGVHDDDIMADYLLTNTGGDNAARVIAAAREWAAESARGLTEPLALVALSVRPEYLDTAFTAIRARHGTIEAYLHDELSVNEARAETIRANYILT